jgi:hypothetical protein
MVDSSGLFLYLVDKSGDKERQKRHLQDCDNCEVMQDQWPGEQLQRS